MLQRMIHVLYLKSLKNNTRFISLNHKYLKNGSHFISISHKDIKNGQRFIYLKPYKFKEWYMIYRFKP